MGIGSLLAGIGNTLSKISIGMDAVERARTELVNSPYFNLSNAGVLLLEPATLRIYRANTRAQEILGYNTDTLHQMSFYDLCIEEPATIQAKLRAYQRSSKPGDCDVRVASGEWRIIEVAPKRFDQAHLIQLLFADLTGVRLAWRMLTDEWARTGRTGEAGYTENTIAHHGILQEGIHLLDAPPGAPGSSPGEEAALPPFHHHVV